MPQKVEIDLPMEKTPVHFSPNPSIKAQETYPFLPFLRHFTCRIIV
jgi:hypothetical protein